MELLVHLTDRLPPDHPHHHLRHQAGDVIACHEDGADWGRDELAHPDWRIVRVPGLTQVEADALVAAEIPRRPGDHQQALRLRHLKLDLDALARTGVDLTGPRQRRRAASFAPEVRADGPYHDCEFPAAAVRAAMALKPPALHPSVVGPVAHEAGV